MTRSAIAILVVLAGLLAFVACGRDAGAGASHASFIYGDRRAPIGAIPETTRPQPLRWPAQPITATATLTATITVTPTVATPTATNTPSAPGPLVMSFVGEGRWLWITRRKVDAPPGSTPEFVLFIEGSQAGGTRYEDGYDYFQDIPGPTATMFGAETDEPTATDTPTPAPTQTPWLVVTVIVVTATPEPTATAPPTASATATRVLLLPITVRGFRRWEWWLRR